MNWNILWFLPLQKWMEWLYVHTCACQCIFWYACVVRHVCDWVRLILIPEIPSAVYLEPSLLVFILMRNFSAFCLCVRVFALILGNV